MVLLQSGFQCPLTDQFIGAFILESSTLVHTLVIRECWVTDFAVSAHRQFDTFIALDPLLAFECCCTHHAQNKNPASITPRA